MRILKSAAADKARHKLCIYGEKLFWLSRVRVVVTGLASPGKPLPTRHYEEALRQSNLRSVRIKHVRLLRQSPPASVLTMMDVSVIHTTVVLICESLASLAKAIDDLMAGLISSKSGFGLRCKKLITLSVEALTRLTSAFKNYLNIDTVSVTISPLITSAV